MKKTLLKNNVLSFSFLVLLLGAFNVSQAQNLWTGATNNLFMTATNWTTAPAYATATPGTDNLKLDASATTPVLLDNSAAATPGIFVVQLQTATGTELTTASDITSSSTSLSMYVGGKLHITGGTFWGKGNIYFGNSTGELPYCNIETGGTLKTKSNILVGRNAPCTIDVNGGTITGESLGSIAIGNYFAAGPGIVNLNSGNIKIYKVAGFAVGAYGTCNVYGGKVEFPVGDLVVKGTLNVNGGIVNFLGTTASTINTAATAGTINLNSGSITVGGTLTTINTVINVDSGTLVLAGDQTLAMATNITNNVLKVSGAALTAGKTLSNTFDSVTGLTTIMAVLPGTAPSALDYTTTAGTYTVGTAIADNPKSALTLGTGTTATYTVSPALPAGLVLDPATGTISGTPAAAKALTTYYVKASTDYGFTTKAITIVVSAALGIDSFEKAAMVKAYPNPTTDTVTVSLPNAAVVQKIAVYNSLGQLVRTETKNTVSLQNLANGNYYLTIFTAEGNYSKKIIKK